MGRVILIILCCVCAGTLLGQGKKSKAKKTDVLFTVNNKPVPTSEFIYLYKKNHQAAAEGYTREDILSYLDLYINFKLKVEEAKQRGMDTTTAFLNEYNSYRSELIKPYLPDNKIIDSLTALTYERLKTEVKASHILVGVKPDASAADTAAAYTKIQDIRRRVLAGEDFGALASTYSDDPSAKTNKGDLGYFTALQMVYPFETAAYQTKVGSVSEPIRTQFGYHIVNVTGSRAARGEVEVSHIMIRRGDENNKDRAKNTIFEIYDQLNAGASWEELCSQYSEDNSSKTNGGRLRPFGVGAMSSVPEFDRIAFSLQKPGDISDPFETAFGWHIVRLEQKIPLPSFDEMKTQLRGKVAKNERVQLSRQAWQTKLKKEFNFVENGSIKSSVFASADTSLAKGKWKPAGLTKIDAETLFTIGSEKYPVHAFAGFIVKNQRAGKDLPAVAMEKLYNKFVDEQLLKFLEQKIVSENAEFGMLAREYYEGILLFDIMEKEVWNKAADDSTGQVTYFNQHRGKYKAGERVKADFYYAADSSFRLPLHDLLTKGDSASIKKYVNEKGIKAESGAYEKNAKVVLAKLPWQPGVYSAENGGMYYLAKIWQILPAGEMTFEEARASVVADYQQQMEDGWIGILRKKYPVKVNEKAKQYALDTLQKQ